MPIIPTPPTISNNYIDRKPIFVMRLHSSMSDMEYNRVRDDIHKSELAKEYHVIAIKNDKDRDEFEMFNSDKIERQDWNKLINQIIK